jgi:L-gulonate 3-dehydrogenase
MRVVIIGSGLIGRCWSVIFARAKCDVFLFDTVQSMLNAALVDIGQQLEQLNRFNLLFNQAPSDILKRVQTVDTVEKLNELFQQGIDHVQECIPEDVEMKIKLFLQLDETVPVNALIASSSSCIAPSQFTEKMKTRNRCIVAHPINPPTTIPLVEIIGAPWTDKENVDLAIERYRSIGMEPIRLKKEVDGFVVNRLQYAVLEAALQLVQDGVADPDDVDRAITHGLACRWSFMGPFQTIDLNAPKGIIDCKLIFTRKFHYFALFDINRFRTIWFNNATCVN